MPTLRPDSIFSEYAFSQQEYIAARSLSQIQICYLQTLYATYFKQKATVPLPVEVTLDRDYLLQMAELEGKLGMIQELLDGHKEAIKELSDPQEQSSEMQGTSSQEVDTLATRASKLVNQIQEQ